MSRPTPVPGASYRPHPLASLPETLDVNYYKWSPERRRVEAERLAIRARLKYEYQLKLNDPHRVGPIEDPALVRWTYARRDNVTQNSRATAKTGLLGLVFSLSPVVIMAIAMKIQRDHREKLIKEGKYERDVPWFY